MKQSAIETTCSDMDGFTACNPHQCCAGQYFFHPVQYFKKNYKLFINFLSSIFRNESLVLLFLLVFSLFLKEII